MLGFLFLFAVGVGAFIIADESQTDEVVEYTGDDDRDVVVSSELIPIFEDLADEGVYSDSELAVIKDNAISTSGSLDVATLGGNDAVAGSSGDDKIVTGEGNDFVQAGDGDDYVDLGDGNDRAGDGGRISTANYVDAGTSALGPMDGGDDEIYGRKGDDQIVDFVGSNKLFGNEGNDYIVSLDAEADGSITPDEVYGGWGQDILRVDEGDIVSTGNGPDRVTIDVDYAGQVDEDYQPVVFTDFELGTDLVALTDSNNAINGSSQITVRELPDGAGASILLDGIEVAQVLGVEGMTRGDIFVIDQV